MNGKYIIDRLSVSKNVPFFTFKRETLLHYIFICSWQIIACPACLIHCWKIIWETIAVEPIFYDDLWHEKSVFCTLPVQWRGMWKFYMENDLNYFKVEYKKSSSEYHERASVGWTILIPSFFRMKIWITYKYLKYDHGIFLCHLKHLKFSKLLSRISRKIPHLSN